jgi:hypothetical protein
MMDIESVEKLTKQWLETVVIGLDLCPFASKPFLENKINIVVEASSDTDSIYESLIRELRLLDGTVASEMETSLLVVPNALSDFNRYLEFLADANELLRLYKWEGVFQLASFHPDYQFAGTESSDVENFTNRSPFPVFHLIREDSLSKAIEFHPDPDGIPERNIALTKSLSESELKDLFPWRIKS